MGPPPPPPPPRYCRGPWRHIIGVAAKSRAIDSESRAIDSESRAIHREMQWPWCGRRHGHGAGGAGGGLRQTGVRVDSQTRRTGPTRTRGPGLAPWC